MSMDEENFWKSSWQLESYDCKTNARVIGNYV